MLVGLDLLSGFIFREMTNKAKGGDTARNEYIAHKVDAPILIFGSSRAIHHYVPKIFRDSLGIDCYNCGQDGMGIILFYGRYKMITQRYIPKVIVYDVLSGFDLEQGDNYSYIGWLKPYYDIPGIDSIFGRLLLMSESKCTHNCIGIMARFYRCCLIISRKLKRMRVVIVLPLVRWHMSLKRTLMID